MIINSNGCSSFADKYDCEAHFSYLQHMDFHLIF